MRTILRKGTAPTRWDDLVIKKTAAGNGTALNGAGLEVYGAADPYPSPSKCAPDIKEVTRPISGNDTTASTAANRDSFTGKNKGKGRASASESREN